MHQTLETGWPQSAATSPTAATSRSGLGLLVTLVGAAFAIAATTARTHVSRILSKLDLRNRVQAVVLAYDTGLVHLGQLTGSEPR